MRLEGGLQESTWEDLRRLGLRLCQREWSQGGPPALQRAGALQPFQLRLPSPIPRPSAGQPPRGLLALCLWVGSSVFGSAWRQGGGGCDLYSCH